MGQRNFINMKKSVYQRGEKRLSPEAKFNWRHRRPRLWTSLTGIWQVVAKPSVLFHLSAHDCWAHVIVTCEIRHMITCKLVWSLSNAKACLVGIVTSQSPFRPISKEKHRKKLILLIGMVKQFCCKYFSFLFLRLQRVFRLLVRHASSRTTIYKTAVEHETIVLIIVLNRHFFLVT